MLHLIKFTVQLWDSGFIAPYGTVYSPVQMRVCSTVRRHVSRYSTVQKEIRFGRVPQVQFRINTILYSRQYSVQSRDIAIQLGTAVQFRENVIGTVPVLHVQFRDWFCTALQNSLEKMWFCTVLQLYGKVQLRVSISMLHMVQFQYSSDKTLICTVFSTAQLSSVGLVENYEPEQFRSRISF